VAACTLALTACGASAEQKGVDRYFTQVSSIQKEMLLPLSRIDQANRAFSLPRGAARRELPALTSAERALVTLHTRLADVEPPPAAAHMHRLLLHLVELEITTARELRGTAVYVPASQKALAPLARANAAFRKRFAVSHSGAAQAEALDAYAADVARVDAAFGTVRPPDVLRPSYDAQRASLARVRRLAKALAAALRAHDRAAVARLVPRFRNAAATSDDGAQARAIRAYNARVRAISRTNDQIQRERARLQRRLG